MDILPSYTDSLRADILPSYSDSLMHHGIKGMHWGIRRYQDYGGRLTYAGKLRYYGKTYKQLSKSDKEDVMIAAKNNGIKINKKTDISYSDPKKNPNYDPKTGLVKKSKNSTPEQDAEMINPGIVDKRFLSDNSRYQFNCTHCTIAYDLRRRGYDVAASPVKSAEGEDAKFIEKMYKHAEKRNAEPVLKSKQVRNTSLLSNPPMSDKEYENLWTESFNHAINDPRSYDKACKQQGKKILNTCESYGPNARGNIMIKLACGGGHSLAFENDAKGRTKFIDTQTYNSYRNKTNTAGDSTSKYYRNIICMADPYFDSVVLRYDNAKPNYKFITDNNIVCNPRTVTCKNKSIFGKEETSKFTQYQYE